MTTLTDQHPTLLVLTPLSGANTPTLPTYAAKDLTQTLEPIQGASGNVVGTLIRETVNGVTVNLIPDWMRKYQSTITCKDASVPCLDGAWLGVVCEVQCVLELVYPTGGTPSRSQVSGSSRTFDGFTFYRPILIMMVTGIRNNLAEYRGEYEWQIDLREVQVPT